MSEPLDELYFKWLYSQVGDTRAKHPSRTYWKLLRQLFTKEFVWFVPNDDNRIADGIDLRFEFLDHEDIQDVDPHWIGLGCSMLELLIGLSRRLAFQAEGEPRDWFWQMMQNLGLDEYNDRSHIPTEEVDSILNRVIFRRYEPDGHGGIFPLEHANDDQTKIEIWYQLAAYVLEKV